MDYGIAKGLYNVKYLEALFSKDAEAIEEFEEEAATLDSVGPLVSCKSIANTSTIKVNCLTKHRDEEGELVTAEMIRLECACTFRIFQPTEAFRAQCPNILVICHGDHPHPIPIPAKTPPSIRSKIIDLLGALHQDLPDLTPRRFMRHPTVQVFLRKLLPDITNPTLSDLHPSLANRDHLRSYITKVQETLFPEGTGWNGLLHLKSQQDSSTSEAPYIRFIAEVPELGSSQDDDGDEDMDNKPLRIAVCMSKSSSVRLLHAHYLQSDIGFKRIVGFKEFELGGLDEDSSTSIVYCRIYVNRQTALAHQLIFQKIDDIVKEDTGENLRWRHLHSTNLTDPIGIFQFTVDQHGGQAKGLGLYLVTIAQKMVEKFDLHEHHRRVQELDPYEHLQRLLRLCTSHAHRNIQKCSVSEIVRNKMRSLICVEHPNWDQTIAEIQKEGGKAGQDWLLDKLRSKFAFPGLCWQKSFIPKLIWQVGDSTSNIIESVHADVNREGVGCTLVGGVKKGQYFDNMKEKTLQTLETTGIRPSYQRGHVTESAIRAVKRKSNAHHNALSRQDETIERHNKKLKKAHGDNIDTEERLMIVQESQGSSLPTIEKAKKASVRAAEAYQRAVTASLKVIGSGSGKVGLLLPQESATRRNIDRGSM